MQPENNAFTTTSVRTKTVSKTAMAIAIAFLGISAIAAGGGGGGNSMCVSQTYDEVFLTEDGVAKQVESCRYASYHINQTALVFQVYYYTTGKLWLTTNNSLQKWVIVGLNKSVIVPHGDFDYGYFPYGSYTDKDIKITYKEKKGDKAVIEFALVVPSNTTGCLDPDITDKNAANMPLQNYQYANIFQKATTVGPHPKTGEYMEGTDKCWNSTRILEYFCDIKKNTVSWNSYNCPQKASCTDGQCVCVVEETGKKGCQEFGGKYYSSPEILGEKCNTYLTNSVDAQEYCGDTADSCDTTTGECVKNIAQPGQLLVFGELELPAEILLPEKEYTVGGFNLNAFNEDIEVKTIKLTESESNPYLTSFKDLESVWLVDSVGNMISEQKIAPGKEVVLNLKPGSLKLDAGKEIGDNKAMVFVNAKTASICGPLCSGTSGHSIGYKVASSSSVTAQGLSSGEMVEVSLGTDKIAPPASLQYIYKSQPVVIVQKLVSNKILNNVPIDLYRFKVCADGEISLHKLSFYMQKLSDTTEVSDLQLFDVTGGKEISLNTPSVSVTSSYWSISGSDYGATFPNNNEIAFAQTECKLFALQGKINVQAVNGGLQIGLAGDGEHYNSGNKPMGKASFMGYDPKTHFVWSDKSSVNHSISSEDWANGFRVKGLDSFVTQYETFVP